MTAESFPQTLRRLPALLQQGRHAEAAAALRHALDVAPSDPALLPVLQQAAVLARTWLTLGRNVEALAFLTPIAESENAGGTLWMLYGHALMAAGRKAEAEAVFRTWTAKEPESRDAVLRLAAVLADSGKSMDAESLVREEVARHGDTPEAAFVLGRALLALSRFDEAETAFRRVVHARPQHQQAQANLMELVWMRSGDVHDASRPIDRALRAQPNLVGLRITKARLLMSARRPGEALEVIDQGLALAGNDPTLLKAASTIALETDAARALDYAGRLLQAAPNDPSVRVEFGNASLAMGRAQSALETAEALHRLNPTDGRALAMKADALRMLGDPRYRELLDYRHLVWTELIDLPDGWSDLASYLSELAGDLDRSHVLRAHPVGNSLRGGSQVQLNPEASPYASIRAFPQAIRGPIRHYLQELGTGSDPMRRRNTGDYRISGIWSVRLRPDGFHVNHYHPGGWISSACYLQLPPAVAQRGGEGWLKFGEPAFPTRPPLGPEYFVRPEPGLLTLFPSYMWHGTVPFSGGPGDTRLTMAFDLVPAATE